MLIDLYREGWQTTPAKGQQGTRGKRAERTVLQQAQIPNDKDYVLVQDYQLWTYDSGGFTSNVTSPEYEGWSRNHDEILDYSGIGTPIRVILEGVARLGDYVKWTRVYPYNERLDYQGLISEHLIPNGTITYDKLGADVIPNLGGMGQYFRYKLVNDGTTPY